MTKSRRNAAVEASGRITRGKKTFETTFASRTRLSDDVVSDCENSVHGTRAASAKTGYGTPEVVLAWRILTKAAKTSMRSRGWRSAQLMPKTLCRYRTLMSRQA